jgi:Glycosyltransferase
MEKLKIIHFITSIDKIGGGTTTYLQLLTEELKQSVELVIATGNSTHPVEMKDIPVVFFNISVWRIFQLKKEFRTFLETEKPDIVHINGIWQPQTWWFQHVARRLGIKVVLSPHGMLEPWILNHNKWKKNIALALYERKAFEQADYLHATAISEKENLEKLGFTKPVAVIANGIELAETQLKENWKPRKKLLFLSRVHPKKGIEHLIDAVARLKVEFEGGEVLIAGEGDQHYIETLQLRVKEKGVANIIKFIGGIYGDQKWKLFREADVFVLPTYSENFGIVVPEALVCGTPVITTKGTPWQELETEDCGWWIEIGTEPLVQTLKEYLQKDAIQLEQMGRRGADLVKLKYSAGKMASNMYNLYKELL